MKASWEEESFQLSPSCFPHITHLRWIVFSVLGLLIYLWWATKRNRKAICFGVPGTSLINSSEASHLWHWSLITYTFWEQLFLTIQCSSHQVPFSKNVNHILNMFMRCYIYICAYIYSFHTHFVLVNLFPHLLCQDAHLHFCILAILYQVLECFASHI